MNKPSRPLRVATAGLECPLNGDYKGTWQVV